VQKQIGLYLSILISTFSYEFSYAAPSGFTEAKYKLTQASKENPESFKVFSWSLENITKESSVEVNSFLSYLLKNESLIPDILILEDFKQNSLPEETIQLLKETYSYSEFFPYQKKQLDEVALLAKLKSEIRKGGYPEEYLDKELNKFIDLMYQLKKSGAYSEIAVFSKIPSFKLSRQAQLDWNNPVLKTSEAIHKYKSNYQPHYEMMDPWIRPYLKFNFPWKGKEINFIPLSLLMPWSIQKKDDSVFSALFKKISITKEITINEQSPHFSQVFALLKELDQDDIIKTDKETLVIGNFNVFLKQNTSWPIRPESLAWVYLESFNFENLFPLDSKLFTYPVSESKWTKNLPQSQVDNAFIKGEVTKRAAEILPVAGSSHYPIYVIVE
jgi:hypothetical protein